MIGWELPPLFAGGLGQVCDALLHSFSKTEHEVTYIMPYGPADFHTKYGNRVLIAQHKIPAHKLKNIHLKTVGTGFHAYMDERQYDEVHKRIAREKQFASDGKVVKNLYGDNLFEEMERFAQRVRLIAEDEDFDVIHIHEFHTYPAGHQAREVSGKPLVMHVHNTIFDRALGRASEEERSREYYALAHSDHIVAISDYVKNMVVNNYGIDPNKITVVHNEPTLYEEPEVKVDIMPDEKVVLFLGRISVQKGPEYFVEAAKRVLDHHEKVKFVVVGSGDKLNSMIEHAASLGIGQNFLFTGWLNKQESARMFDRADAFVMPSVSEPFGLVPYESLQHRTPPIISKTSGISEVLQNCIKVDFWDTEKLADRIISLLSYPSMHQTMTENGYHEVMNRSWDTAVTKLVRLYKDVIRKAS